MDAGVALRQLGGIASAAELAPVIGRRALRRSVEQGTLRRIGPGLYVGVDPPRPLAVARVLGGSLSHLSAAEHHQFAILRSPSKIHVTIPHGSARRAPSGVVIYRSDLPRPGVDFVTSPLRTVRDCARTLPFAEALALGDSALRQHAVGPTEVAELAASARGNGAGRLRTALTALDAQAESALESALRAILIEAGFTGFVSQYEVVDSGRFLARVDFAFPEVKVVLEADGFEWHGGSRAAVARDNRRTAQLQSRGWVVVRFTWEDIVGDPLAVRDTIQAMLAYWGAHQKRK